MRRAIARGRILPQSLSTDPRYGRLSLKAQVLYPLLWINCDDQGRVSGDPDEIKYAACPSVSEITADEIPTLLEQMEAKGFLKVYTTSKTRAIQMLDWWDVQRLQWAYPSEYPPPEGWTDRLRYHPNPKEIITKNWPPSGQLPSELLPSELPSKPASALGSKLQSDRESSKEIIEEGRGKRRGRGILPSALGSRAPPSPVTQDILAKLKNCYPYAFGKQPNARISAQLRDLAIELSAAGCPLDSIDGAFSEAAGQNKFSVSYVRAILLDWLGIERVRERNLMQARSAREIWEVALGELQIQVNKANYEAWLGKTIGLSYQNNQFVVGVPNTSVAEYLDKNQRSLIEKTLIGLTHHDIKVIFHPP